MSAARRLGVLAGVFAAVVALCAGCSHGSPAPATGGDQAGQLGSQLDQLQSTLDSVSAQVNADSAP